MERALEYRKNHLLAKAIVFAAYMIISIVGIEAGNPYLALTLGTPIWFFGVNAVAYLVECLQGHEHLHHRI